MPATLTNHGDTYDHPDPDYRQRPFRPVDRLHLRLVLRVGGDGRPRYPVRADDIWIKAYFAMGAALLIQSCITMTKTVRDVHESGKLVNRIEDARAERLLMGIERNAA